MLRAIGWLAFASQGVALWASRARKPGRRGPGPGASRVFAGVAREDARTVGDQAAPAQPGQPAIGLAEHHQRELGLVQAQREVLAGERVRLPVDLGLKAAEARED